MFSLRRIRAILTTAAVLIATAGSMPALAAETLENLLKNEGIESLAEAARRFGDARCGAIVFFQPHLACTTCHVVGGPGSGLGPDLAQPTGNVTDTHLVEAVLHPSKTIRKGYEPVTIVTQSGKSITGLLIRKTAEAIVLREADIGGKERTISWDDIDEVAPSNVSVMPAGQVNQLASRGQFLDLIRYLIDITEGGPSRASELKPNPSQYALPLLPEYETRIDHASMISGLDHESYTRGEVIYNRLCINCHGTHDRPGSLPTSRRFATDAFKNGSEPHRMYQTLTLGYGLMAPQTWMVPEQKYDVIHYIRESYLKENSAARYQDCDAAYLASLPSGNTYGPAPQNIEPWSEMDYGRSLIGTYEVGSDGTNFAYKGIAVRLDPGPGGVSRGSQWMVFDHDTLRWAAAWNQANDRQEEARFIDWNGIHFNGIHAVHPRVVGHIDWENPIGPGWANPEDGSFSDPRIRGRDQRPYGPISADWARLKGIYHYGSQVIIAYRVRKTDVLEMPGVAVRHASTVFRRTMNIGPRERKMILQVARHPSATILDGNCEQSASETWGVVIGTPLPSSERNRFTVAAINPRIDGAKWTITRSGDLRLRIPPGLRPLQFVLSISSVDSKAVAEQLATSESREDDALAEPVIAVDPARPEPCPHRQEPGPSGIATPTRIRNAELELDHFTHGGPQRWPHRLRTTGTRGAKDGPFAIDILTVPEENPWQCRMRLTGLDFFADGRRAAVCTWDGDVWIVSGVDVPEEGLTWQRFASGLFQPLGLKIVDDQIYVGCRDQIVQLHDLNGDGEADFYENFNNDHQVTEHFHEFAMGLQSDADGNFYYAKSARHALRALVPHHGTLLRVSRDGKRTDIVANGFRAANGVCLNPDGTFIVTDQEGHWNPKNRINWVQPGRFYGNMFGYHDVTDSSDNAMEQPLCWITNAFDRSPAELLWVDSDAWGPLDGTLLNLSYGYGKIYVVPHEKVDGRMQGGMCALPIPQFPTGLVRARFHPSNGQLYACGMFAWGSNQQLQGGLYRVRYTGKPVYLPVGLHARHDAITITFSGELDPESAGNKNNFAVKVWSLKRTASYGSDHYNERRLEIDRVILSDDRRTLRLEIPDLAPTWCMEIKYRIRAADGESITGTIHNTIHRLDD